MGDINLPLRFLRHLFTFQLRNHYPLNWSCATRGSIIGMWRTRKISSVCDWLIYIYMCRQDQMAPIGQPPRAYPCPNGLLAVSQHYQIQLVTQISMVDLHPDTITILPRLTNSNSDQYVMLHLPVAGSQHHSTEHLHSVLIPASSLEFITGYDSSSQRRALTPFPW